jgi:ribosomal protein S27AE
MKIKSEYARAGAACASTLRNSSPHASQTKGTVLCPYCVSGFEFRLMVAHVDGRYICDRCGHTAYPGNTKYNCRCTKCLESAVA